ncbi:flagellar motor protein MotB [Microbulbifer aggregans]|uniref:OmpA/MotB family protein n=1 Tax=Microbulbifer aggregans TaxID=1769779 RepID=UPI001CFF0920|nr:OmpA family protein [Microbulbifer aggregans]
MTLMVSQSDHEVEESHWLSVSDLMAGLMMVFLLIAIALMIEALKERDKIKEIAVAYQENQVAIFDSLMTEFEEDLKRWDAEIDQETLTFTFKSPDVLFETGRSDLNGQYKLILDDFFPRYMAVLAPYKASVGEVRIEGHTSSVWNRNTSAKHAYFNNMELSQGRTRAVLQYIYDIPAVEQYRPWINSSFAAVGLSSSKAIYDESGHEDREHSRRVSFRVITNADIQFQRILAAD